MEKKSLRILFMGTPEFAVPSLEILVKNGYTICGVITAPDKPAGRGQHLQESAVKKFAVEHQLPLFQPEKLKSPEFIDTLKKLQPDLAIVVAFRMLPEAIWKMPRLGTFNLHGSLLPQYRGAAPIQWALINGETETGLTTFFLDTEIDTGKIIAQWKTPVSPTETLGELHDRMMVAGAGLVLKTVEAIEKNELHLTNQAEVIDKHGIILKPAPKIFKPDTVLNFSESALSTYNKIRGLSPFPGAISYWENTDGKKMMVKLFSCRYETCSNARQKAVLHSDGKSFLRIEMPDGNLELIEIQAEGKKRMLVSEFLRGFRWEADSWQLVAGDVL